VFDRDAPVLYQLSSPLPRDARRASLMRVLGMH
jgi:hypothetical protein